MFKIILYPDKRLRRIAKKVKKIDENILCIINNMFLTMYEKKGIGLAATQIGLNLQIIVIDISEYKNEKITIINPTIISKKKPFISIEEGCLSIPNQKACIPRYQKIKIQFINKNNENTIIEANNLLSICIQHEIDHLYGKLFIDYLSPIKRQIIYKKTIKLSNNKKK